MCDVSTIHDERKGENMAETIHEKALRLIATGAVTVMSTEWPTVDADVQGDHGNYQVTVRVGDHVRCWCPADGDCSHMLAVLAVALESTTGLPAAMALGPVNA